MILCLWCTERYYTDHVKLRFCNKLQRNPEESLAECNPSLFKIYLHWRVENSRIQKESSIITYWKVLSMLYSQRTSTYMDDAVLFDINNVCGLWYTFT